MRFKIALIFPNFIHYRSRFWLTKIAYIFTHIKSSFTCISIHIHILVDRGRTPLTNSIRKSEQVIVGQKSSHPFISYVCACIFLPPLYLTMAPNVCTEVPAWQQELYFRWSTDSSRTGTLVLAANLTHFCIPRSYSRAPGLSVIRIALRFQSRKECWGIVINEKLNYSFTFFFFSFSLISFK